MSSKPHIMDKRFSCWRVALLLWRWGMSQEGRGNNSGCPQNLPSRLPSELLYVVCCISSVLCGCVFKKNIYQGRVDWSNLICSGFRHSTSTSPTPFFFLSRFGHRHQELLVITVWYIVLQLVWLGRDGLTMCKTKLFPYTPSSKICSPLLRRITPVSTFEMLRHQPNPRVTISCGYLHQGRRPHYPGQQAREEEFVDLVDF